MIKRTLQELCLNITDGKHGDCENEENSGYYFISCKDIFDGQINYKNARQITKADFEETHKRTMLEVDDILLTNSGTIGRMAFVTDREATTKTTFQKSVAIIKPDKQKVLPRYLYYQLQNCVPQFINSSNGSAQKNLLLSTMRTFQIEIEENCEKQEKIANTLSAYDDLIENNQKQIKLLEEAAQRLYKEWFVDLRFPGHENTKIVDGVPEGWSRTNINEILTFHRGYDLTKNEMKAGRYPVVGSTTVIGYHNEFKIKGPGIVTGRSGSLGKYQFIWDNFWPHNTSLYISDYKDHNIFFVYSLLQTVDFASLNNGGAIPTLNRNVLSNIKVIEPTDELQEMFAKIAEAQYRKIRNLEKQNNQLKMARDVLLPKLMSGEVEV
jgi:type I restriction enzyme S subunit